MLFTTLRLAVVVTLLVIIPGVLLVNALIPPATRRVSRFERAYLSIAGGAMLLMLVGVTLGSLPHDGEGYFRTFATGFPFVELAMLGVSAVLFYVGMRRGAYPWAARAWPRVTAAASRVARPEELARR